MSTRVSLDGEWQVKPYEGMDWLWRDAHLPRTRDLRHWHRATVPGTLQHDLWQAGETPNPYFERNSLLLEWIPARTWVYRRTFRLDPSLRGQRALLRFEGIDYEAQVFLNGARLGSHTSMYTPAQFEVSELLDFDGENTLAVVLEPAPREQPQVSRSSLVRTHKSRMTYWWDFCPRMVHVGLWDSVVLHFSGAVRLFDVFVRPQLNTDLTQADIAVQVSLDSATPASAWVEVALRLGDAVVGSTVVDTALAAGQTVVEAHLALQQPALWYPNGLGAQPLYVAEVRVLADDTLLDNRSVRFGIRRIEFVPNESADPTARPYTLVVNGQRAYIKGWNWVPIDVMYGVERPAKLGRLLTLARDAHVNLLRVWGGGLIEKEAFYARCDEMGLLIWQEFIQSSSGIENIPPCDPDFIAFMRREAEAIVPRKRNHPSLVVWCGGNELIGAHDVPLDDTHPLLAMLRETVARLDPDRHWLPTSPSGRVASNTLDTIRRDPTALHDVHGPWEYQGVTAQHTLYNAGASLLHSEFGVEGITNQRALDATIAPENQRPVTLDNPLWQHLGAWWVKTPVWRATWGEVDDVPTLVRATQFMQAEGLRYALEADRRRKYHNSGTLPWQFNEPYPMAACTSAVDYYAQPKPVYYAVAHAYEPIHVSARFATSAWAGYESFAAGVWVNNSTRAVLEGATLTARIVSADGRVIEDQAHTVDVPPDCALKLVDIMTPLTAIPGEVFFLDLALSDGAGVLMSRNRYTFSKTVNLEPLLRLPPTTMETSAEGEALTLRNVGDTVALAVWLEDDREVGVPGYLYLSEAGFSLLPGEARTVTATWTDVEPAERRLSVAGWNTARWEG